MTIYVYIEDICIDLRNLDFIWNEDSIEVERNGKKYKFSFSENVNDVISEYIPTEIGFRL